MENQCIPHEVVRGCVLAPFPRPDSLSPRRTQWASPWLAWLGPLSMLGARASNAFILTFKNRLQFESQYHYCYKGSLSGTPAASRIETKGKKACKVEFPETLRTSTGCCHRHPAPAGLICDISRWQTGPQGPAPAPPLLSFSSSSFASRTVTQSLLPVAFLENALCGMRALEAHGNGPLGLGRARLGACTGPLESQEHPQPSAQFSLGRA